VQDENPKRPYLFQNGFSSSGFIQVLMRSYFQMSGHLGEEAIGNIDNSMENQVMNDDKQSSPYSYEL
jgi:hypothetical protein